MGTTSIISNTEMESEIVRVVRILGATHIVSRLSETIPPDLILTVSGPMIPSAKISTVIVRTEYTNVGDHLRAVQTYDWYINDH